jgi:molybdopterin synthase sulfur carrier subunit
MIVKVLYFASFRERVGRGEDERTLAEGARVGDLWQGLAREVPHFAAFPSMPPAAVNLRYAEASTVLRDGDEVAFLPPVAGG